LLSESKETTICNAKEIGDRMNRKLMGLLVLSGSILFGALPRELYGASEGGLVAKTVAGKVEGKGSGTSRAFLGIPYAAPPVGDLRWKAPAALPKWKGVRPAKEFGQRCMQGAIYPDMVFRDAGNSEDCLTLNVWTEARDKKLKLPVMVWI
jgi:para-nitrobenzyl esterase